MLSIAPPPRGGTLSADPDDLRLRHAQADAYLALHRVHGGIREVARAGFRDAGIAGITPAQADALMVLFQRREPLTARQLAAELGLSEVTVGRFVKALEEHGWVARAPDPRDGRARLVSPTARARASLPAFAGVSNAVLDAAFAGFSRAEIEAFSARVRRIRDNLATGGAPWGGRADPRLGRDA